MQRDLTNFNPKRPPPRTAAWWAIVEDHRAPEEDELLDAIDKLGNPDALIVADLIEVAPGLDWLHLKQRLVRHRLERCDYNRVINPDRKKAVWKIKDRRVAIYARKDLTAAEQLSAARKLLQDRQ
jgi:hypothetical protein